MVQAGRPIAIRGGLACRLFGASKVPECGARACRIFFSPGLRVCVTQSKLELSFARRHARGGLKFRNRMGDVTRIEIEQPEKIMSERILRLKLDHFCSDWNTGRGIDPVMRGRNLHSRADVSRVALDLFLKCWHCFFRVLNG